MPRRKKNHSELTVRVSFETTRLSTQCLIEAYECLAPSQRWVLRAAPELRSMLVAEVQAAACSSAACTGSPSRKRIPWITWARRSEPSSRRQLRSADLASL